MKPVLGKKTGLALVLLVLMSWGSAAQAMGLGFFFGSGSEDYNYDAYSGEESREFGYFGFIFDTAVHTGHVINYRLQLGSIGNISNDFGYDFGGVAMTHTLGFRLLSTPQIRLWGGPQLHFAEYDNFEDEFGNDVDGDLSSIGLGAVLGMNLNFQSKAFSLGWDLGIRNNSYEGTVDGWDFNGEASSVFVDMYFIFRLLP